LIVIIYKNYEQYLNLIISKLWELAVQMIQKNKFMNNGASIIYNLVNYLNILMIRKIIRFHPKIIVLIRVIFKNSKKMQLIEFFNILQMILCKFNIFAIL